MAEMYLREHGYLILARNYRFRRVELDLICMVPGARDPQRGTLVFVEVKFRTSRMFGWPESAVTLSKQKNIVQAARAFVHQNCMERCSCRFDVISIRTVSDRLEVRHFQDAFRLS